MLPADRQPGQHSQLYPLSLLSPKREARQQKQQEQLSWLYPLFKLSLHKEARQQKQQGQLSWLYPLFKLSLYKEARQQKQQGQHATWHSLSLLSLLSSKLFSLPLIRLAGRQAAVLARRLAVVQTGVEFDHPGAAPSRVGAAAFHLVVVAAARDGAAGREACVSGTPV